MPFFTAAAACCAAVPSRVAAVHAHWPASRLTIAAGAHHGNNGFSAGTGRFSQDFPWTRTLNRCKVECAGGAASAGVPSQGVLCPGGKAEGAAQRDAPVVWPGLVHRQNNEASQPEHPPQIRRRVGRRYCLSPAEPREIRTLLLGYSGPLCAGHLGHWRAAHCSPASAAQDGRHKKKARNPRGKSLHWQSARVGPRCAADQSAAGAERAGAFLLTAYTERLGWSTIETDGQSGEASKTRGSRRCSQGAAQTTEVPR